MIIENLYQLDYMDVSSFSGQMENRSSERKYPIMNVENLAARKVIIAEEFENDVKMLCEYANLFELRPGMTIHITLQEILKVIPRKRKRIDSYSKLVKYLKEQLGVDLIICSQKTKNHEE